MTTTVLTASRLGELLNATRTSVASIKENVQEMLIIACYFAFKDGNTTPLNSILDLAVNSKAIGVERITRWVELHAKIAYIRKEQFVLNKQIRDAAVITGEESFAETEAFLRTLYWYDSKAKDVAKSVFDIDRLMGTIDSTIKAVKKHESDAETDITPEMFAEVVKSLKSIKGKVAQMAIVEPAEHQQEPEPATETT